MLRLRLSSRIASGTRWRAFWPGSSALSAPVLLGLVGTALAGLACRDGTAKAIMMRPPSSVGVAAPAGVLGGVSAGAALIGLAELSGRRSERPGASVGGCASAGLSAGNLAHYVQHGVYR